MKQVKKLLTLVLAVMLVLTMAAPALAATIQISNSVEGQIYNAYKIFDVTNTTGSEAKYAYTIAENSSWLSVVRGFITANSDCGLTVANTAINGKFNVTIDDTKFTGDTEGATTDSMAKKFADYLKQNMPSGVSSDGNVTGTGSTTNPVNIENLGKGYYFVTSSLGSLCMLSTAADTAQINEKNATPDIDKKIVKSDTSEVTSDTAGVGDTVTFALKITAGGNAATSYIVHDVMSAGLQLRSTEDSGFTITQKVGTGDATTVSSDKYTIKIRGRNGDSLNDGNCAFEISFPDTYTKTLEKDSVITITYQAIVLPGAVTNDEETNKVKLQYGNGYSEEKQVKVNNYGFSLVKTDTENVILSGAQFELYKDQNCTQKVNLIQVTTGTDAPYYRPTSGTETEATYIEAGNVKIDGLANGTYYLKEIKAPDGYNPLEQAMPVTVNNADNWASLDQNDNTKWGSGGLQIKNQTGQLIPTTGGIGTTIFYILGGILVVGAGLILITRRRMNGGE